MPLRYYLQQSLSTKINGYATLITEKTGLSLTYKSMSPSLLSSIYIRDIEVFDIQDDSLLKVSNTHVSFNLFKLIGGDFQQGISSVVLNGIELDADGIENLISKIQTAQSSQFDFNEIQRFIPGNIKLKNINLVYDKNPYYLMMNIKNIGLKNDSVKQLLDVDFDSNVSVKLLNLNQEISGRMDFDGTVTHQLENSQLNIKFSNLTNGDYRLNKLNFHVAYEKDEIQIRTIQTVNPVSLAADFNIHSGDINVQLRSKNLNPVSLITINSRQKQLKKLKKLTVNTDTIIDCNLKDKTLNFISDSSAYIPPELFPDGFNLDFSVYGNENSCELTKLNIEGQKINASAKLSYIYKNMQLSGLVQLPYYILNNNTQLSTEIYFDAQEKGFMAFAPQLFMGDKALTGLQLNFMPQNDSYDFALEGYDYSHSDESDPGLISIDGSFLLKSKYVQTNISLSNLYFDSLALLGAQFTDEKISQTINGFSQNLSPYVLSGDIYASTDFKTISYNVPYLLAANTKKDNQVLMLAFNGSEQNVQFNQISLVYGKYALEASGTFDSSPDSSDKFFTVDLNSSSIPYHFSGSVMSELVNISGDYGIDLQVRFAKNNAISGHLICENLPLVISNKTLIFSTDADFNYDSENGPEVKMDRFEAEFNDESVSVNPKLVMSGNMTKYGAQINSIAYTDLYSALEGSADFMLNINDKIFDSVGLMLNLKNPLSDEAVVIDGSVSNPELLPLNKETVLNNLYFNLQLQLNSFGLNRFGIQQNDNNVLTATLYTSGTIEHPYVSLNVEDSAVLMASEFLRLNGSVILEDRDLEINDLNLNYSSININNCQANASLEQMTMNASADLNCQILGKTISAPLNLTAENAIVPDGKFLPDSITFSLASPEISGDFIKKAFPFSLSVIYSDHLFNIYSSDNVGLTGSYSTDGILELSLNNKDFVAFNLDGYCGRNSAALSLSDCDINLKKLCSYIDIDNLITVENGMLTGGVALTGSFDDPDFSGLLTISEPQAKLPFLSQQRLSASQIDLTFNHNEIEFAKTVLTSKNGARTETGFNLFMNKWTLNHLEGRLKSVKKDLFPLNIGLPWFVLSGDASVDLQLYMEGPVLELTGKIFGENIKLNSSISNFSQTSDTAASDTNGILYKTDLDITLGTHASINFDPILRCVFVPNTSMNVKMDMTESVYNITGELKLKSGDLAYLNRNFYIKSGIIKFNPDDLSNPLVTINAETRERDEKNQNVKIILDVENQYLNDLNPHFTSVPAKSENEIRSILGQIAVGDSSSATNFLFAASDYAIQSTVVRTAENKLRDLFNFDIFSVRTNVIQNTLNMGVSGKLSNENLSIGNFLDNSTVYIGKYLGSSLYLDAMLHVSFENSNAYDISSAGSVIFQPEFGMEMESPFANIRINMAPDINALLNRQFVPSASVTLSWKFSY